MIARTFVWFAMSSMEATIVPILLGIVLERADGRLGDAGGLFHRLDGFLHHADRGGAFIEASATRRAVFELSPAVSLMRLMLPVSVWISSFVLTVSEAWERRLEVIFPIVEAMLAVDCPDSSAEAASSWLSASRASACVETAETISRRLVGSELYDDHSNAGMHGLVEQVGTRLRSNIGIAMPSHFSSMSLSIMGT